MALGGRWTINKFLLLITVVALNLHNVFCNRKVPTYVMVDSEIQGTIVPGKDAVLQIRGKRLSRGIEISLTKALKDQGSLCDDVITPGLLPVSRGLNHDHAKVNIPAEITKNLAGLKEVWVCSRYLRKLKHDLSSSISTSSKAWRHQGSGSRIVIAPFKWIGNNLRLVEILLY